MPHDESAIFESVTVKSRQHLHLMYRDYAGIFSPLMDESGHPINFINSTPSKKAAAIKAMRFADACWTMVKSGQLDPEYSG